MTALDRQRFDNALARLLEEAVTLSAEYDEVVQDAVRLAVDEPLDEEDARSLITRILTILRTLGRELDAAASERAAAEIREECSRMLEARSARIAAARSAASDDVILSGGLVFHAKFGLRPRPVVPVPTFNGQPISLTEGYVDVTALPLWMDNHRVRLHVQEFRELNHRDPEHDELLDLLQGKLALPGLDDRDPFKLRALADSVARKGVERPPVVTYGGEPKDGNRRIAASRLVLSDPAYSPEQKDRARWIRVWQAPEGTTDDQFEAIVVALNFEPDHKVDWPEYVKARLVIERYRMLADDLPGLPNASKQLELRKQVAEQFAISHSEVRRYLEMVRWADDFEAYHVDERELDPARVRYRANDIFQWFYEIQAGKGTDKLIHQITVDDNLRAVVYDLMFDVLDSGAQVRHLHQVVADDGALSLLLQAHGEPNRDHALRLVDASIAEAAKNSSTRRIGFEQFLRSAVDRLGGAPPDQWRSVDDALLIDLERVLRAAIGTIEGELGMREARS